MMSGPMDDPTVLAVELMRPTGIAAGLAVDLSRFVLGSTWLAEHDARVRAEVLREAAVELLRDGDEVPYRRAYNSIYAAWLRERADVPGRLHGPVEGR